MSARRVMALKAASRCRQSFSFAAPQILKRREQWLNVGSRLAGDGQQRGFAKEAQVQKTATPNPAKNVKARTAAKKEEKKEQRERFSDLIDACLNAPSPVRALKEKDRLRLLEREKLGVVSQERLREVEQEKVREKASKAAAKKVAKEVKAKSVVETQPQEEEEEGRIEEVSVSTETPADTRIELTAEEGQRLAKECSRVLLTEHRARAKSESVRLKLQKEAIAALPQDLREAAVVPDLTPFPKSRIPASLTPPIRGYIDDRATAAAHAVTLKKSR